MGLDELLPEGATQSGKSSSQRNNSSGSNNTTDSDYAQVVTGANNKKKRLTEDQWEKAKRIIRKETPYTVNKVLNNLPADERYEVVHNAMLFNEGEKEDVGEEHTSKQRCNLCRSDCSNGYVELEGESFCVHHTSAQVANSLGKEVKYE